MPSSLSHNSSTRVEGGLLLLLWEKTVENVLEKYELRPRIDGEEEGLPAVCSGSVERLCLDVDPSCCCRAGPGLTALDRGRSSANSRNRNSSTSLGLPSLHLQGSRHRGRWSVRSVDR